MNTDDGDEKHLDALRRYGWLRVDENGDERLYETRDVSDGAMKRYAAYADGVKRARAAKARGE